MRRVEQTVGFLRQQLAGYDNETKLTIDGNLHVYRVKSYGEDGVHLEFSEYQAEISSETKKNHPEIKVAFCDPPVSDEAVTEVTVPRI